MGSPVRDASQYFFSPESLVSIREVVVTERVRVLRLISDVSDDDVVMSLAALNVIQSYVSDMLAVVRAEMMRREVNANPMFVPDV